MCFGRSAFFLLYVLIEGAAYKARDTQLRFA